MAERTAGEGGAGNSDRRTRRRPAPGFRFAVAARMAFGGLSAAFVRETERGRHTLWAPVLLASGIAAYFAMPTEPSLTLIAGLTAVAVGAAAVVHRRFGLFLVLSAIALVAGGVALMTLRTALVATPVISADYTGDITGWVESIEQTGPNVRRLVVVVDQLEDLAPSATPRKVRITVRARFEGVGVGAGISGLVALFPPPGPVIPGGYDFGRDLFYRGIGGSGFSYGAPDLIDLGPPPFSIRMLRPVSDIRNKIGARIEAAVPNEAGGILKALVTGDRGGISDETTDILRRAGLGHILAISGLHMALVVGAVFGGLRALLALSPALALRRPIKKWAAVGALAAALAYLLLSGGSIATQRAFIMATVVLVAVLIDRRAFSIRNVAVAATIILLLTPEALITASFQMSFAATIALIAGFEFLAERRRKRRSISRSPDQSIGRTIWLWVSGMAMTSLLAGLATAPFAAFHFHRTAPLSLFANVAAMPIFTLLVMPMALLGVLLMPLGLEQIPLAIAGLGHRQCRRYCDRRIGMERIGRVGAERPGLIDDRRRFGDGLALPVEPAMAACQRSNDGRRYRRGRGRG